MEAIDPPTSCTPEAIVAAASGYAFGRALVSNNFRAIIVEAMLRSVLPNEWTWCSQDWGPWDFQHRDGTKLEVKQAAAKQSWETTKPPRPTFDIKPRTGRYEGTRWIKSVSPERFADSYVFGYHPREDATADHREPKQWEFYVLLTTALPEKNSLSLRELRALAVPVNISVLCNEIERVHLQCSQ